MIQKIFGSPVVILKTDNVQELFSDDIYNQTVEYLTDPKNNFVDHPLSRGGQICTTSSYLTSQRWLDTINELPKLVEFLKKTALKYSHCFFDTPVTHLKFHSSWVNLIFQGCEINNHNDRSNIDEKTLIVLFYPKAPVGGSNLVFIRNGKEGDWVSDQLEQDLVQLKIEEGNIVIFDNSMFHAVSVHNTNIPRMSIATEFTFEK